MSDSTFQSVHFIGIGGVGMSGLAAILLDLGVRVSGSDAVDSPTLERLARRGARVASGHAPERIPTDADLAVFSSAVNETNPEIVEARRRGLRLVRRGEFLAELARRFPTVVSVAGSHGKTTTSAMITHILREAGLRPGHLIGGDVPGWSSPAGAGAGRILVSEVDESDGTQAFMQSSHAVVTNVDDDHCWSLGGVEKLEECFQTFSGRAERLFCHDEPTPRRLFPNHPRARFLGEDAVSVELELTLPGRHNRANAALALAVAEDLGVPRAAALAALRTFPGVSRRLSVRYESPGGRDVVIEDYAHHPVELAASLQGLRERWPGRQLVVIFQPHRFERVKRYATEFSQVLDQAADAVYLIPPFAAWLQDRELADPRRIVAAIRNKPSVYWEKSLEELADALVHTPTAPVDLVDFVDPVDFGEPATRNLQPATRLFAVIGAGDVGRLAGLLKERLSEGWLDGAARELRTLPELAKCEISRDRIWSELTTLGAGLARPLVAAPQTLAQLQALLGFARDRGVPAGVLGGGSNLVGADWEPPRLWLHLRQGVFRGGECSMATPAPSTASSSSIPSVSPNPQPATRNPQPASPPDCLWRAGCGVTLRSLFDAAIHAGMPCAEFAPLAWIPGTLGGALRMNAGADGVSIGGFVEDVEGVHADGSSWRAAGRDVTWGYRTSSIPEDVIITSATLRLPVAAAEAVEARLRETGDARRVRQPEGRSAGCVFKNAGAAAAGRLADAAGCKGMAIGGARVSERHANFIVTDGHVSEKEVLDLLLRVRQRVYSHTGVLLMPEVKFAGTEAEKAIEAAISPARVVVLKGGPSSERKISLSSGTGVANALRDAGFRVEEIEFSEAALPELPAECDVVFPVLHGVFGEDGQIQTLLEARGVRYVGSGPAACKLIMDKLGTKKALLAAGAPTAKWAVLAGPDAPMPAELKFPVVVKPNEQGSSIGISKVDAGDGVAWKKALATAFALDPCVFAEEFIPGVEITVGVLDGKALPVVEIHPCGDGRWYDYDAKYDHTQGHTEYLCPPRNVAESVQEKARQLAEVIYRALGAKDLLRVDFIVGPDGTPWCLEANAIPGFTPTSLMPKAAAAVGISFPELCARLVKANL